MSEQTFAPAPKPQPRSAADRLNRRIAQSRKLEKSRRSPIAKSTKPIARNSRSPVRNTARKASEFARCFGSVERVQWVKSLPCLACLLVDRQYGWGKIENAHVARDGSEGMSRRGGFRCIAPLCRGHHIRFDRRLAPFHDPNQREFIERHGERIAQRWDQLQAGGHGSGE